MIILQNGEDGVLTIEKPFDTVDRVWQGADATAAVTLYDENGNAIAGATDLALTHVAGTTGQNILYRGEVAKTVTLPGGTFGEYVALFTNAAGKTGKERGPVRYDP